ncbi:hypothetical protein [Actinoplanes sp. NPDC049802]|uniref:hypothetical protein n=1 Tax=Actinoplanes sp. NPDC049802 TaxID=3154742 RepID=UPI00340085EB
MSDGDKDAEILALRHQIMVLERQLGGGRVRCGQIDEALSTLARFLASAAAYPNAESPAAITADRLFVMLKGPGPGSAVGAGRARSDPGIGPTTGRGTPPTYLSTRDIDERRRPSLVRAAPRR